MLGDTWWKMHILAILLLTILCIASIVGLTLAGKQPPDLLTIIATGGAAYFLGTQTQATKNNIMDKKDDTTPKP